MAFERVNQYLAGSIDRDIDRNKVSMEDITNSFAKGMQIGNQFRQSQLLNMQMKEKKESVQKDNVLAETFADNLDNTGNLDISKFMKSAEKKGISSRALKEVSQVLTNKHKMLQINLAQEQATQATYNKQANQAKSILTMEDGGDKSEAWGNFAIQNGLVDPESGEFTAEAQALMIDKRVNGEVVGLDIDKTMEAVIHRSQTGSKYLNDQQKAKVDGAVGVTAKLHTYMLEQEPGSPEWKVAKLQYKNHIKELNLTNSIRSSTEQIKKMELDAAEQGLIQVVHDNTFGNLIAEHGDEIKNPELPMMQLLQTFNAMKGKLGRTPSVAELTEEVKDSLELNERYGWTGMPFASDFEFSPPGSKGSKGQTSLSSAEVRKLQAEMEASRRTMEKFNANR